MSVNKYIENNAGQPKEMIPATVSSGAATAGQLVALNAAGNIDISMIPPGVAGSETVTCITSAAISAGMLVNIYNNSGTITARPADNTTAGSEANGYATAAVANGVSGTFNLGDGLISGLSGLTVGANYWLGTVGAVVAAAPSASGNLVQLVGKAFSATELMFAPSDFTVVVA